jgi:hypothetical protein
MEEVAHGFTPLQIGLKCEAFPLESMERREQDYLMPFS